MASDFLIKIEGIRGESKDKAFADYIDLKGWSYSMTSPMDPSTRQRTGHVQVSDVTLFKLIDKSSPVLLEKCATNWSADTATLIARKAGGDAKGYFSIVMKKVRIRSVSTKATEADGVIPVETVALTYQKIEWTYKEQTGDGSVKGDIVYTYDASRNS